MTTDLDSRPVPSEGNAFCDRCKTLVPIEEWRMTADARVFVHVGKLRNQDGDPTHYATCEPGDDGKCGWSVRIPQNA